MSRELNPATIENTIISQLKQLSSNNIRTSLFNLILFYNQREEAIIDTLLSHIFGKRAARIIHIQNKDIDTTSAYVKVRCNPDFEQNQVCFQEIIIQNGHDNIGFSEGTWVPLCTHDIPIIVIWLCNLTQFPHILQSFFNIADKVIFCTEFNETRGEDPFVACSYIQKNIIPEAEFTPHPKLIISDLTWLKSLPLRQKTASLFEPEQMRNALNKFETIQASGISRSTGLLYFLWLASRLEWDLISGPEFPLQFRDRTKHIITAYLADNEHRQIRFATRDGRLFTLTGKSFFLFNIEKGKSENNTIPSCPFGKQGQLLQELDSLEPDLLYYNTLKKLNPGEQL